MPCSRVISSSRPRSSALRSRAVAASSGAISVVSASRVTAAGGTPRCWPARVRSSVRVPSRRPRRSISVLMSPRRATTPSTSCSRIALPGPGSSRAGDGRRRSAPAGARSPRRRAAWRRAGWPGSLGALRTDLLVEILSQADAAALGDRVGDAVGDHLAVGGGRPALALVAATDGGGVGQRLGELLDEHALEAQGGGVGLFGLLAAVADLGGQHGRERA